MIIIHGDKDYPTQPNLYISAVDGWMEAGADEQENKRGRFHAVHPSIQGGAANAGARPMNYRPTAWQLAWQLAEQLAEQLGEQRRWMYTDREIWTNLPTINHQPSTINKIIGAVA